MGKHLGFTGTRQHLSDRQVAQLAEALESCWFNGFRFFHHGDCVGADAVAHLLADQIGYKVVIHPPVDPKHRAFSEPWYEIREPRLYLDRNRDIVSDSVKMLACPHQRNEVVRSGTWSTIRLARALERDLEIIWP